MRRGRQAHVAAPDGLRRSEALDTPQTPARVVATFFVMTYNQERFVRAAVESAFAQTAGPLEILLSDDCSRDGTFRIMEEMAAAYRGPHRVRLNRNPRNLGIIGHVNRIMELASGEWIVHGAGDDVSEPHRVERLLAAAAAGGPRVRGVHSSVLTVDGEGRLGPVSPPRHEIIEDPSPLNIARTSANCTGAAMMWSREVFDRFGPLPESRSVEDGPVFFRAALLGDIVYVDEPLVRYHTGGLSGARGEGPARSYLYGHRLLRMRWRLANRDSFLRDLARAPDFPQREDCRALCLTQRRRFAFTVALADRGPAGRLALLPEAVALARRDGEVEPLKEWLRYLFSPFYLALRDRRRPAGQGGGAAV